MADQFGDSDHNKPFVVFVPQVGGSKARPYFFDLGAIAKLFARETGGTIFTKQGNRP